MSKKTKDRVEILEEQIQKLKCTIRNRDKSIRQLKSQIKTTEAAWKKTEIYLQEVTNGKPISEVLRTVEADKPLSKVGEACPSCGANNMNKLLFTGFHIIVCECGYRNKVDEEQKIRKS